MEILISFLLALGLITSDMKVSDQEALNIALEKEHHQKLIDVYGEEYLAIVGTHENEKD